MLALSVQMFKLITKSLTVINELAWYSTFKYTKLMNMEQHATMHNSQACGYFDYGTENIF